MRIYLFLLLFFPAVFFAQNGKYKPFEYLGNWGLTDTNLQEVLKPTYYQWEKIPSEEALLFTHFGDSIEYLYFNLLDGSKKNYINYDLSSVNIEGDDYSLIQVAKKYYLKNETARDTIKLNYPIEEIKNLGKDYIIAKYDIPEEPPKPERKGKNGIPIMEMIKPLSFDKNFIIFKNSKQLSKVFKVESQNYTPLYTETGESSKGTGSEIIIIENTKQGLKRNFDYLVFNSDQNYQLYSADFKLIKKFIHNDESIEIAEKCSKLVGKPLSVNAYEAPPIEASYETASKTGSSEERLDPVPEFESILENGVYKIVSTNKNNPRIICESLNKLMYDINHPSFIFIYDSEKEEYMAQFEFDKKTFKLFLPLSYYTLLKLSQLKHH